MKLRGMFPRLVEPTFQKCPEVPPAGRGARALAVTCCHTYICMPETELEPSEGRSTSPTVPAQVKMEKYRVEDHSTWMKAHGQVCWAPIANRRLRLLTKQG